MSLVRIFWTIRVVEGERDPPQVEAYVPLVGGCLQRRARYTEKHRSLQDQFERGSENQVYEIISLLYACAQMQYDNYDNRHSLWLYR